MKRNLTDRQRRELAGRARTLHERLDGPLNVPGDEPPVDSETLLDEWKDLFSNDALFRDRLDHEGLTESTVREQLAATRWPGDEPLPDWIDEIEVLNRRFVTASPDDVSTFVPFTMASEIEDSPFGEILAVVVGEACERLPQDVRSGETISPMIEWLFSRLETVCLRPLYVEFKSFVEHHDPELARADPADFDDPPTKHYERYVAAMFDGGFSNLCLEYPVLARHLTRILEYWVDTVTELWRRLQNDRSTLRERFDVAGDVTELEPLAEDNHAHGRIPVRVSFESGDVIYKPRPVAATDAFFTILDRLNDHVSTPPFASPTCWSKEDYGWMERVEYEDPADEAGVELYYRRAGVLLCTAYVLNFSDIQSENIIAAGETPTIIDGETLLRPEVGSMLPVKSVVRMIESTVLLTALLPVSVGYGNETDEDGFIPSIAGLGNQSDETRLSDVSHPVIEAINTDIMTVGAEHPVIDRDDNTPTVDGDDRPPERYFDEIIHGFEETHDAIRQLSEDDRFFTDIVDRELVNDVENRLVYRESMQYSSIIQRSVAKDPLRDGARLTLEFERLTIPLFEGQVDTETFWPVYQAERNALRRLDVPRLASRLDSRTVYHDDEPIGVKMDMSGYECCRRRLDAMDEADKRRQASLIRWSFKEAQPTEQRPPAATVTDERLQRKAVQLFDDAIDAGIETTSGRAWVPIIETGTLRLEPSGPTFYHGRGGIALTAAALHRVTGEDQYRRIVADIFEQAMENLPAVVGSLNLGGTRGIGSVVYVLSVVAELLDDEAYRDLALRTARMVTDSRLRADDSYEVMGGTAGALLGLLACHDRFGDQDVLDRAVACGEHLLDGRVTVDGHEVWSGPRDGTPMSGFSHGVGGIAYALARLASKTGESLYGEAALDALGYDSTLASPVRTNVTGGHDSGSLDWCHGRAGDALVRVGTGVHLDDEELLAEAGEVLSAAATADPSPFDNLCCGNFGRVEALLTGREHANGAVADATRLASRCLAGKERNGTLQLPGHSQWFPNPTFFDGVSGVAYTLLRLRNPDALPSVLLFE